MQSYHDLGSTAAGPVPLEEHEPLLWEKRVEALMVLVKLRGLQSTDELAALGSRDGRIGTAVLANVR